MTLTAADFFAGAGGSSSGMNKVPGVDLVLAANHWSLAVQTHQLHFPKAEHRCADLSQADFRQYPRVDLLWGSPECTNHSIAQGRKQAQEDRIPDAEGNTLPTEAGARSRATMWDIPRYLEEMIHRGKPVLGGVTENVVDVVRWVLFPAWRKAMDALGYDVELVYLNSAHAHARKALWSPQSRDRVYVLYVLRKLRRKLHVEKWTRPFATCDEHGTVRARQFFKKKGEPWGRYRAQYLYLCPEPGCALQVEPWALPAAEAVDWRNLGQRIGDRAKPLAEKTLKRIEDGLQRYSRPLMVPTEGRDGKLAKPLDEPGRTQTTRRESAVLFTPAFVAELRGGNSKHRSLADPLATVTAGGFHHALVAPPLVIPYYGRSKAKPVDRPLGTLTTVDRFALLEQEARVEDCTLRMLQVPEIARAMSFDPDHQVLGNKREGTRLLGNAVTPPAAEVLMSAVVEAVTGEDLEPASCPA
ncbi:DNA cytosine methyltransferase [Streptomyces gilvifuscus]|uniref:DNA (cytosine-5-)-methyltransferase n=1 Tax=Streptomyces gilvifuscus TaxID=1550617 RepID=A0ABT5FLJ2_9ACTN|nr:DNA cytosine methyltransferase [Streptomyces gilvifuscus]MDC2953363.1 DNA cytosine methyltransferase [Streptomyces gilvifuscus]